MLQHSSFGKHVCRLQLVHASLGSEVPKLVDYRKIWGKCPGVLSFGISGAVEHIADNNNIFLLII